MTIPRPIIYIRALNELVVSVCVTMHNEKVTLRATGPDFSKAKAKAI